MGDKVKMNFKKDKLYLCKECGYHQGISFDGKMKRCKGCGEFNWVEESEQ